MSSLQLERIDCNWTLFKCHWYETIGDLREPLPRRWGKGWAKKNTLIPNKEAQLAVPGGWAGWLMCACVDDKKMHLNCARPSDLKKASRFASWDTNEEDDLLAVQCAVTLCFFLLVAGRSQAQAPLEKGVIIQVALFLSSLTRLCCHQRSRIPHVTKATGAYRARRLS